MLYYIKQHISKFVFAGHDETRFEVQGNSSNTIIPIREETSIMEVKRLIVSWIYEFLTVINIIPTNKIWLNVF